MEESGRTRYSKQGQERGTLVDENDPWRSQHKRVYSPKTESTSQGKRAQVGNFGISPKRGGYSPPGRFNAGHSPSQRDAFKKFPVPDNHTHGWEENWRDRPRWRKDSQGEDQGPPMEDGFSSSGKDPANEDAEAATHSSGGRRRLRDRRRGHAEREEERLLPVIDETLLSARELLGLRQAEERISRDEIYRLKKRLRGSPRALYSCSLCDVLLDSVSAAHKHIKDKWHKRRARERREEVMLTEILPPGQKQVTAVGSALEKIVQERGLSDQDVEHRKQIVSSMETVLRAVLPEVKLRLYGSSCTKFGFKDSDINIDIQFPSHMHQPDVLLLVQESLSKSSQFVDLVTDFHARVPVVICTEKESNLVCKVSAGNDNAYLTTAYFLALGSGEPRLLPLVLGFRHWAQICHVDSAEEGGLPSYVMPLMVIYFLQQCKEPLLPAYLGPWVKEFSLSRLSDFSLKGVEDDLVLWEYNHTPKEATPPAVSHSRKGKSPLVFPPPRGSVEVGLLWVELLRFYSVEFNLSESVISVRFSMVLSREAKDWPKKRIAVEDPFSVKRNVARTMNSQLMYEYFLHCLKTTYKYFALPFNQLKRKPEGQQPARAKTGREQEPSQEAEPGTLSDANKIESDLSALSVGSPVSCDPSVEVGLDKKVGGHQERAVEREEDEEEEGDTLPFPLDQESLSDSEGGMSGGRGVPHGRCSKHSQSEEEDCVDYLNDPLDEASLDELLSEEEEPTSAKEALSFLVVPPGEDTSESEGPCYEFSRQVFTRGKSHTVVCSLCKRDGHLKRDCPEDFKRLELDPLPPMTPKYLQILNEVCERCYRDFAPDELEEQVREHILRDLEAFIKRQFKGATLRLFGSSKNGFGFKQSDLDICMVLEGQETAEGLDCISIIDNLTRLLRRHMGLRNILPILTAKVPIVKFYHMRTGLEGDISLYNTLALHNTRLLASYAAIDPRVKLLCYVMKVFAKVCDIGDASRGSLSSYAYTLMALFFLQQRQPPVIPVLQEIFDGPEKPEVLVDGWNVYFYDDLQNLPSRWPEYQKNQESVGALWLGLLQFYTEEFDFKEHVICIRRKALLTTFKKQWTSKYIVIEDPFDLNHNLGAGLSRRMTNFIMKAFINGRRVFGSPVKVFPPIYSNYMEYFFDPEVLTEGELAPNDRCCRICGKIGHFMKDCPIRKKSKQRRDCEEGTGGRWDGGVERTPHQGEHWRRHEDKRCCFLCGSHAHIKRECPQYRGPAGGSRAESAPFSSSPSSSQLKTFREKEKQGSPQQEEKRKQKVILSPQAGSLVGRPRPAGRSGQPKSPAD